MREITVEARGEKKIERMKELATHLKKCYVTGLSDYSLVEHSLIRAMRKYLQKLDNSANGHL